MSMHEYEWRMNKEELKDGWVHEYVWRMNIDELKDEWVYMNMNGRWIKKNWRMDGCMNINGKRMKNNLRMDGYINGKSMKITKGWMDEYWVCMNKDEDELKDEWVYMNMNGTWMKKN